MNIVYLTVGICAWEADYIPELIKERPSRKRKTGQRQNRISRRRRWAAGDKKAFNQSK